MATGSEYPRRQFLQQGIAAVGASVAAPRVMATSALGDGDIDILSKRWGNPATFVLLEHLLDPRKR